MKFRWFMEELGLLSYYNCRETIKHYKNYHELLGYMRIGHLYYDIVAYSDHIAFDLYVGEVDTRSNCKVLQMNRKFQFEHCPDCSFICEESFEDINSFKEAIERKISDVLASTKTYVTSKGRVIDLISKANEDSEDW